LLSITSISVESQGPEKGNKVFFLNIIIKACFFLLLQASRLSLKISILFNHFSLLLLFRSNIKKFEAYVYQFTESSQGFLFLSPSLFFPFFLLSSFFLLLFALIISKLLESVQYELNKSLPPDWEMIGDERKRINLAVDLISVTEPDGTLLKTM